MKTIIKTFFTLFITSLVYSQSGEIKGGVVGEDGNPVAYVNVSIENSSIGTYTKTDGTFKLTGLSPGRATVIISNVGYKTLKLETKINANKTTFIPKIILIVETEGLNEVVVKGNAKNKFLEKEASTTLRLKTEIIKLPQNIQVISEDLLENQGILNMMESITKNISGAQMIEHWGNFARINMRGFKLPAFRNGMNVEMPWGPLSEDMSMVERIEFVKGPSGFMMSAGEPGGFYNVVTKKPTERSINEITLTAGSFNTFRGTLDSGGKLTSDGKLQYRFNGMYQTADSYRDFENSNRFSIVPSLKYKISNKTSLSTELTYQKANMLLGSAYVFALPEDGLGAFDYDYTSIDRGFPKTKIDDFSVITNITHKFNDKWSIEAQHAYFKYEQEGASFWVWGIDNAGNADRKISIWDALSTNQLAQIYFNGELNTGTIIHKIMGGYDYRDLSYYADWSQKESIDVTPFNIYNPVYGKAVYPKFDRSKPIKVRGLANHQGNSYNALYLQDEIWMLKNKLRLTLAARYTDMKVFAYGNETKNSKLTPRVGLSFDVLPSLTVYGLYDQSFSPQFGASFTNKKFKPVEAKDIEGGIKKTWFNGKLNTSITAYQITKENILVADPENPNFSIQLGEVQSKGIEVDVQGRLTPQLDVIFNYANTNVEITKDTDPKKIGTKMTGYAKHITNGWLNYTFPNETVLKGIGVSLGYQYQIDRSSWAWSADNEAILPDYFRLDGGISWRNRNLRINLNINNLLNKHLFSGSSYSTYVGWQNEPKINGRLTIAYTF
ncbi:TonB-dependent receptor [Polaribacter cellanae]|uniref:TonB-dependent receptor n=1 Tax=Polaribacter cellanae TaxID=2818493 RepID=A0A975CNJ7_9FLAO|nr:TonB-dependent receptor [Polaribacter cellanae]QTE22609.1 TonB-dependent receptor [Polaribacter cellanae]